MKTEIKYAVIFVVLSFIWNCIEYFTGLQTTYIYLHQYFVTSFFILLTFLVFLFALREKRSEPGGKITFGKAFLTGVITCLIILILNPLFLFIFYKYINPAFFHDFAQYEISTGKTTKEDADSYYTLINFIFRGTIYRIVMAIAASLLIAIFMKKHTSKE